MKPRHAVILALGLALALAVPAFAGQLSLFASSPKNALRAVNGALREANAANGQAAAGIAAAQRAASEAEAVASSVKSAASAALGPANAAKVAAETAQANANAALSLAGKKMSAEQAIPGQPVGHATVAVASVSCPGKKVLTGGGFKVTGAGAASAYVEKAAPSGPDSNTWEVKAQQIPGASTNWSVQAIAQCAESPQ